MDTSNILTFNDAAAAEQSAPGNVLHSARLLLSDLASTLVFLSVVLVTHDVRLAVILGMATGIGQIVWALSRRRLGRCMQKAAALKL